MDIKTTFTTDKDQAVLEEAIREKKASVEEYNEILADAALLNSTRSVLEKQKKIYKTL